MGRARLLAGPRDWQAVRIHALAPIAYWSQSEAAGAAIYDLSGNGRHGAYITCTLAQPGIGDGRTAVAYGGSSGGNVYSAGLAGAFNGAAGAVGGWFKAANAGVWTDGIARRLFNFQASSQNLVRVIRSTSNGILTATYIAGNTTTATGIAAATTLSTTDWFHVLIGWNKASDVVRVYFNGVQVGADLTGLGTWAGSLGATTTMIGATTPTPSSAWSGSSAHVFALDRLPSAAEVLSVAVR